MGMGQGFSTSVPHLRRRQQYLAVRAEGVLYRDPRALSRTKSQCGAGFHRRGNSVAPVVWGPEARPYDAEWTCLAGRVGGVHGRVVVG